MAFSTTLSLRSTTAFFVSPCHPGCIRNRTLNFNRSSQFLSSKSFPGLKKQFPLSNLRINRPLEARKSLLGPRVFASQSNFLKVVQTAWKVGKDGVDAGTNLVPDSVPRPIARIGVTVVAVTLGLFVLKSFLSTAFFVVAMMGLIYFTFIALNKDDGPKGGGGNASSSTSTDDSLEEARRIMEKYK